MHEQLLGYLLNALDPETHQEVESHLANSPESRNQLARLRRLLEPLAEDKAESIEPPAHLLANTLRLVEDYRARHESPRPLLPLSSDRSVFARGRWGRPDILVAAGILFVALMMTPPTLLYLRAYEQRVACANNLANFHQSLARYADDHGGALPKPDDKGFLSGAGSFVVKLKEANCWDDRLTVVCPANGPKHCGGKPMAPAELAALENTPAYELLRRQMGGCYAYALGYVDGEVVYGLTRKLDGMTPIMADRSPRPDEVEDWRLANSSNHGRKGQNVLHVDGHVSFCACRRIGEDDIFVNQKGRVAAGLHPRDAVLAPSEVPPRSQRDLD